MNFLEASDAEDIINFIEVVGVCSYRNLPVFEIK